MPPPPKPRPGCYGTVEVAGFGLRCIALPTDPAFIAAFRALCEAHGLREYSTAGFLKNVA